MRMFTITTMAVIVTVSASAAPAKCLIWTTNPHSNVLQGPYYTIDRVVGENSDALQAYTSCEVTGKWKNATCICLVEPPERASAPETAKVSEAIEQLRKEVESFRQDVTGKSCSDLASIDRRLEHIEMLATPPVETEQ
tara:strand:- start:684 stop:1097 length:414 start_codon:yes stop_codon:yes gene_type:complete